MTEERRRSSDGNVQEILSRLGAVETAQNGLAGRVALVEQEQKHTREILEARVDTLAAQFRSFETSLLAFDVKLDKIVVLINATASDPLASPIGRQLTSELEDLRREAELNTTARIESATIVALIKWVGFPGLLLCLVGVVAVFGRVNHLW